MKVKRNLLILLTILLFSFTLAGCESETVAVNVENSENINGTAFGRSVMVAIGDGLWYDSTTKIVYWWNGSLFQSCADFSTTPSPYYAPNGLPYRYNPETNTFEEIEVD